MPTARLLTSISALALLTAAPAGAASFNITGNETAQQTLNGAETGTITSTGRLEVSGGADAASAIVGTDAGSINNAGYVSAAGTSNAAIKMTGTVTTLTNSGTMTTEKWTVVNVSRWTGSAWEGSVGSFTNTLTGKIIGTTDDTVLINVLTGSFVNHGEITNTSTYGDWAVYIRTPTGTVENTGLLEAAAGPALGFGNGGARVTNSGTIKTGGATALQFAGGNNTLTLHAASSITGKVDATAGTGDRLVLGGTADGSFDAARIGTLQQYAGFESFAKTGTSKWTLTGTSTEAGSWAVDAGILSVAGSLANMNVVLTGGTLMGGGTVGDVSLTGATIAPGNSIGTLTVHDIVFGTGSVYEVELSGTQSDRIIATGTATFDDLTVNATGTASSCGAQQFTLLTATNPLVVNNAPVLTGSAGGTLSWDTYNLFLDFAGSGGGRTFSGFTDTANQEATAQALDALGCNTQPYAAALNALTDAEVPAAMDALSGEGHAAIAAAMIENAGVISGAAATRLEQAFDKLDGVTPSAYGAVATLLDPAVFDGLDIWANAYGLVAQRDGDGNAAPLQSMSSGIVFGADRRLDADWVAGLLGGLGVTGTSAAATTGQSLDASLGAYAGAELGVVKLKAGAAYTRHFIATARDIVFPGISDRVTAAYQAGTAQGFVELSTDIAAGETTITPFGRLEGVRHATESFTETGGEGALATAASAANALFATIGIGAEQQFVLSDTMLVTARGSLAWRHAFADQVKIANSFAGGGPFTIASAGIATDVALLSAGLSVDIDTRTSLDLGYEGALGSGRSAHALKLTLSGRF